MINWIKRKIKERELKTLTKRVNELNAHYNKYPEDAASFLIRLRWRKIEAESKGENTLAMEVIIKSLENWLNSRGISV